MNRRGFTLIELMVVVVVIGILASFAIPRFLDYARSSREAEAKPQLKQIYTLQYRFEAQHGVFAGDIADLEGGAALVTNGRFFEYSVAANGGGFCVVATPSAEGVDAELNPQSIDERGAFHESADCS